VFERTDGWLNHYRRFDLHHEDTLRARQGF